MANKSGGAARTYVVRSGERVAGYFSLAPASVEPIDTPARISRGQARHSIPCILLARMAVDKDFQGMGLGKFLFRDALLRSLRAHEQVGARAFLVHALDEEACAFYMRYGMMASPTHPNHPYLLFKDMRALIEEA